MDNNKTVFRGEFREEARKAIQTPEQFTDSLKITGAGVWLALAALLFMLAGAVAWGVYGFVEVSYTTNGIAQDGVITCYVPGNVVVSVGMAARVDDMILGWDAVRDKTGVVTSVELLPVSVRELYGSYMHGPASVEISDHSYSVTVTAENAADGIVDVTIIREGHRPMFFLTGLLHE